MSDDKPTDFASMLVQAMERNRASLEQRVATAERERDDAMLALADVERAKLRERASVRRGERCPACGKPTSVGEDFDGPCVHDSDLSCALRCVQDEKTEARRCYRAMERQAELVAKLLDENESLRGERDRLTKERDEARAAERADVVAWLRNGAGLADEDGLVYGPYDDAVVIVRADIANGCHEGAARKDQHEKV